MSTEEVDTQFKGRPASTIPPGHTMLRESALVRDADDGSVVVGYLRRAAHGIDLDALDDLAPSVKVGTSTRANDTTGVPLFSRNGLFGYTGRSPFRNRPCRSGSMNAMPVYPALRKAGVECERLFAACMPEQHAIHVQAAERILPDYRIGGSVFTSGVFNRNNLLPYHRDGGNVPGGYSAMIGLRRGCSGGELIIPEYGLVLPIEDGSITIFEGSRLLHGVRAFASRGVDPYRITIVYYTYTALWKCLPVGEEIARETKRRSEFELKVKREGRKRLGRPDKKKDQT